MKDNIENIQRMLEVLKEGKRMEALLCVFYLHSRVFYLRSPDGDVGLNYDQAYYVFNFFCHIAEVPNLSWEEFAQLMAELESKNFIDVKKEEAK